MACRLCLTENCELVSLSETRSGFPISVLAMIICPVKIFDDDLLSKEICDECLEVLISAYKLRDISLRSENLMTQKCFEKAVIKKEVEEVVAEDCVFAENLKAPKRVRPSRKKQPEQLDPSKNYMINLYNSHKCSKVWQYIGLLCESNGLLIDNKNHYCRICFDKGIMKKRKISNRSAPLLKHLINHGIDCEKKKIDYICDKCGVSFHKKRSLDAHMTHTHINNVQPAPLVTNERFTVDCYKKKESGSSSTAWDYYGRLLEYGKPVEEGNGFHYCRLCVEQGIMSKRYTQGTPTSALMYHLERTHQLASTSRNCATVEIPVAPSSFKFEPMDSDTPHDLSMLASFDYHVHCFKASSTSSLAWKYFGQLVHNDNSVVESEKDNYFCKLCKEKNGKIKKFKRTCTTSPLFYHLTKIHGIKQMKNSQPSSDLVKTCSLCNVEFDDDSDYLDHLRSEHASSVNKSSFFLCTFCGISFELQSYLANHVQTRHANEVP